MAELNITGNLYRHLKTGKHYRVELGDVTIEATMERGVVYRGLSDGVAWVRPYSEFMDGRFELATGE